MSSFATLLLRKVTAVHELADGGVRLDLVALPGVRIDPMPGWITGEPLLDQGVETTMPNLPDIELPDTTPAEFGLEIHAVAADTVRLRVGRPDAGIFADDGTGLGIVTDPAPAPVPFTVTRDEHELVLTTAALSIQVGLYPFRIRVADAESRLVLRTSEFLRQVAGFPMAPAVAIEPAERITLNLEIGPDELVSGFGEQFGPVVKNGQDLVLSIQDALGTGTGLAYKPVPVWQSSRGITGFVNTGTQVRADVGHTRPSVLSLTVPDDTLDLYLVVGPDPKARLASYTALTGRAYVPDPWAFGYWMGRCRYHTAAEMLAVADGDPVLWVNGSIRESGTLGYMKPEIGDWNEALVETCQAHPEMRVYDWDEEVDPDWFEYDGVHYTPTGYSQRSRLTADALVAAFPGDKPLPSGQEAGDPESCLVGTGQNTTPE